MRKNIVINCFYIFINVLIINKYQNENINFERAKNF